MLQRSVKYFLLLLLPPLQSIVLQYFTDRYQYYKVLQKSQFAVHGTHFMIFPVLIEKFKKQVAWISRNHASIRARAIARSAKFS